jgi:hypothetical protein
LDLHEDIFGVYIIFIIWIYLQPTNVFFHDKHNILIYVHGIDIVYPYLLVKVKGNSHMILFIQKGFKGRKKGYNLLSLFYHSQAFFSTYLVSELLLNYYVKVIINEKDFL